MAFIVKEQDSGTVSVVGSVIVISGGGLTVDQATKVNNLPSNTSTELATKAPIASPTFTGTVSGVTKSMVGLGNVDNTSDANKPVSSATQTALNLKANSTDIATINTALSSKADLVAGKIPASQLPDGIDEVQEYANLAAFPITGSSTVIYIALDTNKPYRWSGTQYAPTDSGIALGETSATAYRGDRGVTAYDHSQVVSGNPHGTTKSDIGLGNTDNTSDADKPVSTAQQTALDLKANLASPTFTGTVSGITKTMVGLSNVDNTSDLNKPISTAVQTALDAKANPGDFATAISITGTHVETTQAISFSSNQGQKITLTANRTFTISTTLSASNPIGKLKIVHSNFTPTFSDVDEVIEAPINKNGTYYLVFEYQPDGTITQRNSSGGGASSLEELSGITNNTATENVNVLDALLAGFKPTAPSIVTALNGNNIDITITPGAEDSRFATTLYNIYRSTDGGNNYTLYDTEATTTYTDVSPVAGTYHYYVTAKNAVSESNASNTDSESISGVRMLVNCNRYPGQADVPSPNVNGEYVNNLRFNSNGWVLPNLVDVNGNVTGYGFEFIIIPSGYNTGNLTITGQTYAQSGTGLLVQEFFDYRFNIDAATISTGKFTGMVENDPVILRLIGGLSGFGSQINFSSGIVSDSYNSLNNGSDFAELIGLLADVNGEVGFNIDNPESGDGIICGFEIEIG